MEADRVIVLKDGIRVEIAVGPPPAGPQPLQIMPDEMGWLAAFYKAEEPFIRTCPVTAWALMLKYEMSSDGAEPRRYVVAMVVDEEQGTLERADETSDFARLVRPGDDRALEELKVDGKRRAEGLQQIFKGVSPREE